MTNKEEKIVELLREGKSYTEIQTLLEVSPSKISQIKKEYFISDSDEESTTDTTTFTTDSTTDSDSSSGNSSDSSSENSSAGSNIEEKSINNIKNNIKLDNEKYHDPELHYSDMIALEKLKINLAHEAAMKRLENESMEQELRWRDQSLREKKANADEQFLKEKIAAEMSSEEKSHNAGDISSKRNRNIEERSIAKKKGKHLVFTFRRLIGKLIDGEWTKGEIVDFICDAENLKDKIEIYCFAYNISLEGLRMMSILKKVDEMFEIPDGDFDEFLKLDDEHTVDIKFEELYDIIEEAKKVDFDTYE